jgi:hypothetical protein
MTLAEFEVAVGELHDAIGTVRSAAAAIENDCTAIKGLCATLETAWVSPAGQTFTELTQVVNQVMDSLTGLLDDTVTRMQTTYDAYLAVEKQNTNNVTPGDGKNGPSGSDSGSHKGSSGHHAGGGGTGRLQERTQAQPVGGTPQFVRAVAAHPATTGHS